MSDNSGEVRILLDEEEYTLRPSLDAIRKIESRGLKLMSLLNMIHEVRHGLTELALVVWAGVNAHGDKKISIQQAEELVFKTGFADQQMIGQLVVFISNMVSGGKKAPTPEASDTETPTR